MLNFDLEPFFGILLLSLTGILSAIHSLIVKVLVNYHPFTIVFWGSFGWCLTAVPIFIYALVQFKENAFDGLVLHSGPCLTQKSNYWKLPAILILSRVGGLFKAACQVFALKFLEIGDAMVIKYATPVTTLIMSYFILSEKCELSTIPAVILAMAGVAMFSRPGFLQEQGSSASVAVGISFALTGNLLSSILCVSNRRLRTVHIGVLSFTGASVGLIGSCVLALAFGVFKTPNGVYDLGLMVSSGLIISLASIAYVLALKRLEAGTVSIFQMHEVIYGFVIQFVVFGVIPDQASIIGTTMVMSAVLIIVVRKAFCAGTTTNKRITII